jgi:ATP-dependent helicase HrpB
VNSRDQPADPGSLLAAAYPDRVAQTRGPGRYRLRHGGGAVLPDHDPLAGADWLVAADVEAAFGGPGRSVGRIRLAAAVDRADVERVGRDAIRTQVRLEWDPAADDLRAVTERTLDALVLDTSRGPAQPGPATTEALVAHAIDTGLAVLGWAPASRALQARATWARQALGDDWPDVSDDALAARAGDWLAAGLHGAAGRSELARVDPSVAIRASLGPRAHQLDRLLPTSIEMAGGRRVPVDYSTERPRISVRAQDLYGTTIHPAVADGRVPVTVEVLSPAGRPIQVTADLPGFWRGTWHEVRKEMAVRYPKHAWPEDPATAPATAPGAGATRRRS